jgi:hypothetical protein
MLVGLSFASLICIPLIQNGVEQISDQYVYSQYEDMVGTIDSQIRILINSTEHATYEGDIYIPRGVTISSSTSYNEVTYYFSLDSIRTTIRKVYPLAVAVNFNYEAGWYMIKILLENTALVVVSFSFRESG